jgi:hypothetical protein
MADIKESDVSGCQMRSCVVEQDAGINRDQTNNACLLSSIAAQAGIV